MSTLSDQLHVCETLSQTHNISEALLRAVIGTAVDGIMVIDEEGMVRLYNAACVELFGYGPEDVVGRNVSMLMPAHHRENHDGYLAAYKETGKARVIGIGREVTAQRKDGSEFPILLSVGEAWHNDTRFFVGIVHDITEQKQSEERLRVAKEAAESASRAKSDFLAVMSHEVRTPLHGILATTSLLKRAQLSDTEHRYAQTIQNSGETLLDIVDSILDLARVEAGAMEVKRARFLPRELLDSVELLWESRVQEKGLDYFTRIDPGVPSVLIGDIDRIREILNNLVNNAVKFTEEGYVAVKLSYDAPAENDEDRHARLRFEVSDSGVGIVPEDQARLFGRFEQGDTSLTRKHGGSGLGLAICKELAALLGGEIGVSSRPGKGSRFWFSVSCWVPKETGLPIPAGRLFSSEPMMISDVVMTDVAPINVLVAEDCATNQMIIRDILEYNGHSVDIVPNGREAIDAALSGKYQLIFMDVRMPDVDGLQATTKIRQAMNGAPRVPIVALTAHAMSGDRDQCLAAGMDDYISKPFTIAQITEVIAKHVPVSAASASAA